MSIGLEHTDWRSPEAILSTAAAMALRSAQVELTAEEITSEILEEPFAPTPLLELAIPKLVESVLKLVKVEDPDGELDLLGRVRDSLPGLTDDAYWLTDGSRADNVRQPLVDALYTNPMFCDASMLAGFEKQLTAAKQVALGHDTDLATVFTDDTLYYEAARKVDTPEGLVRATKCAISAITDQEVYRMVLDIEVLQNLHGTNTEPMGQLPVQDALWLQLDPDTQQIVSSQTEKLREATRQSMWLGLVNTFGKEALDELSPSQRAIIEPQMSPTRLLRGVSYSSNKDRISTVRSIGSL